MLCDGQYLGVDGAARRDMCTAGVVRDASDDQSAILYGPLCCQHCSSSLARLLPSTLSSNQKDRHRHHIVF